MAGASGLDRYFILKSYFFELRSLSNRAGSGKKIRTKKVAKGGSRKKLRRGPVLDIALAGLGLVPGNQSIEIVAIGPVCNKRALVEQALRPASGTNLVGITLGTNRPAHLPVPAPAQEN